MVHFEGRWTFDFIIGHLKYATQMRVLIQMRVYSHELLSDVCIKGSKRVVLLPLAIFESAHCFEYLLVQYEFLNAGI